MLSTCKVTSSLVKRKQSYSCFCLFLEFMLVLVLNAPVVSLRKASSVTCLARSNYLYHQVCNNKFSKNRISQENNRTVTINQSLTAK